MSCWIGSVTYSQVELTCSGIFISQPIKTLFELGIPVMLSLMSNYLCEVGYES